MFFVWEDNVLIVSLILDNVFHAETILFGKIQKLIALSFALTVYFSLFHIIFICDIKYLDYM